MRGLWKAFRAHPVATLTALLTGALSVLTLLQGLHILHGQVATWLDGAVALLTLILGWLTHQHVTPLAKPRASDGTPLIRMGDQYPIR